MPDRLNQHLLDGESIRWSGRPSPFHLLNSVERTDIILTWVLSLFVLVASTLAIMPRLIASGITESLLVLAVIVFLPGLLSLRPLINKHLLERQTIYAITNYRVIALIRNELMYIPLSTKLQVDVESQGSEHGTIRFSSSLDRYYGNTLSNAVSGVHSEGSHSNMRGMWFYHIANPNELLQYFAG